MFVRAKTFKVLIVHSFSVCKNVRPVIPFEIGDTVMVRYGKTIYPGKILNTLLEHTDADDSYLVQYEGLSASRSVSRFWPCLFLSYWRKRKRGRGGGGGAARVACACSATRCLTS